jgi:hypothetical protein
MHFGYIMVWCVYVCDAKSLTSNHDAASTSGSQSAALSSSGASSSSSSGVGVSPAASTLTLSSSLVGDPVKALSSVDLNLSNVRRRKNKHKELMQLTL